MERVKRERKAKVPFDPSPDPTSAPPAKKRAIVVKDETGGENEIKVKPEPGITIGGGDLGGRVKEERVKDEVKAEPVEGPGEGKGEEKGKGTGHVAEDDAEAAPPPGRADEHDEGNVVGDEGRGEGKGKGDGKGKGKGKGRALHPWEVILNNPSAQEGIKREVFRPSEIPKGYKRFDTGNTSFTQTALSLAYAAGKDVYELKRWIRPKKYGPRLVGIAVPEDIYNIAKLKMEFKEAKERELKERRMAKENEKTEKLRKEWEAELSHAKDYVKWKWPELTEEEYARFFEEFYTFSNVRKMFEDGKPMEDICENEIDSLKLRIEGEKREKENEERRAKEEQEKLEKKAKEKKEKLKKRRREKREFDASIPLAREYVAKNYPELTPKEVDAFFSKTFVMGSLASRMYWPFEERIDKSMQLFKNPEKARLMEAKFEMLRRFPSLPESKADVVIDRAWSPGRVGTVKKFTIDVRCELALEAHIRYNEADFESCKEWYRYMDDDYDISDDYGYDYRGYDGHSGYRDNYRSVNPYAYMDAWMSLSDKIAERLAFYSAAQGEEPTKEMKERGKEIIEISMANCRL